MSSEGSGGAALGALRELTAHWQRRLPLMAGAPQALEPVLAVRCGVLREVLSQLGGAAAAAAAVGGGGGATQHRPERLPALVVALRDEARRALGETWQRAAKSARAAGHLESAQHALMQAMLHDVASGTLLAAKMEWEAAGRGETDQRALTRLQQQLRCLRPASSAEGGALPRPLRAHDQRVLTRTLLRLARYLEESGQGELRAVQEMYDEAASLGSAGGGAGGEEKAHFWLGHFHDGVLRKALQSAARAEVVVPGGQAAQRSCPSKRVVSQLGAA